MKFSISKRALLPELTQLAKVSGNKLIQVLDNILFEACLDGLYMTAGDNEISMAAHIENYDIEKTGTGNQLIPAKKLLEIVKRMGETISFESDGLKTTVKSGKSTYNLSGMDWQLYPKFPEPFHRPIRISGEKFKEIISRTDYAVSTNENNHMLQGIKFVVKGHRLTATACDRHRLAEVTEVLETTDTTALSVVRGKLFEKFAPIIDDKEMIKLIFEPALFSIDTERYKIALRVLDGSYPDTSKVVPPSWKTHVTLNRDDFKDALERALVIALADKNTIIRFDVGPDHVRISSSDENNKGEEFLDATVDGDQIIISFNGKYMVQALNTVTTENVILHFNGMMQPITIYDTTGSKDVQMVLPYRTQAGS